MNSQEIITRKMTALIDTRLAEAHAAGYNSGKRDGVEEGNPIREISHQLVELRNALDSHSWRMYNIIYGVQKAIIVSAGVISFALPFFYWLIGVGKTH